MKYSFADEKFDKQIQKIWLIIIGLLTLGFFF